jgi:hypothetical protein
MFGVHRSEGSSDFNCPVCTVLLTDIVIETRHCHVCESPLSDALIRRHEEQRCVTGMEMDARSSPVSQGTAIYSDFSLHASQEEQDEDGESTEQIYFDLLKQMVNSHIDSTQKTSSEEAVIDLTDEESTEAREDKHQFFGNGEIYTVLMRNNYDIETSFQELVDSYMARQMATMPPTPPVASHNNNNNNNHTEKSPSAALTYCNEYNKCTTTTTSTTTISSIADRNAELDELDRRIQAMQDFCLQDGDEELAQVRALALQLEKLEREEERERIRAEEQAAAWVFEADHHSKQDNTDLNEVRDIALEMERQEEERLARQKEEADTLTQLYLERMNLDKDADVAREAADRELAIVLNDELNKVRYELQGNEGDEIGVAAGGMWSGQNNPLLIADRYDRDHNGGDIRAEGDAAGQTGKFKRTGNKVAGASNGVSNIRAIHNRFSSMPLSFRTSLEVQRRFKSVLDRTGHSDIALLFQAFKGVCHSFNINEFIAKLENKSENTKKNEKMNAVEGHGEEIDAVNSVLSLNSKNVLMDVTQCNHIVFGGFVERYQAMSNGNTRNDNSVTTVQIDLHKIKVVQARYMVESVLVFYNHPFCTSNDKAGPGDMAPANSDTLTSNGTTLKIAFCVGHGYHSLNHSKGILGLSIQCYLTSVRCKYEVDGAFINIFVRESKRGW